MIYLQFKTNSFENRPIRSINTITLWTKFSKKGLMMDQEKVTRVDFSLNAVRNTYILVSLLSKSVKPVVDMHNKDCVICSCGRV